MNPTTTKRAASIFAAGAMAAFGAGCGVNTAQDGKASSTSTAPVAASTTTTSTSASGATTTTATTVPQSKRVLPRRPNGTLALDVQNRNGISALAASKFTGARVALSTTNENRAYADLCAGRVDVVETSNVPTLANYKDCSDNGLQIADAIQTASDAIVLATKNESDIGGDCITVQQARDIYRSGSPYTNWSQLGFDALPLRAAGREEGSQNFQFFGFQVLGQNDASLADVRSDYRIFRSDATLRRDVTNQARIDSANRRADLRARELRASSVTARQAAIDKAVAAADAAVQKEIKRVNNRNRRLKIIVDGEALAKKNAKLSSDAKLAARRRVSARYAQALSRQVNAYRRGLLTVADAPGVVGPFRFSYYTLYEEKLRPLEIDYGLPETESGQPVRYGDLTVAQQRRIAPALRKTIAEQNGTDARGATAATAIPADTTLAGLTNAQLPTTDKNGKTVFNRPNCVFPAQQTITSGAYPLSRRTFLVTTKTALRRPEVVSYLKYNLDNARALANDNTQQLVPITDQQIFDGLKTIGVSRPQLPADPVAPTGPVTTSTDDTTTTTTTGGQTTTPAETTSTSTDTTTTPAPAGDSSGIPGVSNRGG